VLQDFTLDFYGAFAEKYDKDPRIAFVQTGFGLWAEYHIYDGPFVPGSTFPDKRFQKQFLLHLDEVFDETKWSISIDAFAEYSPLSDTPELVNLDFGLFDDSFMQKEFNSYNRRAWAFFGENRYLKSPAGGELSYMSGYDQRYALSEEGLYGVSYKQLSSKYHISYMIGNDQTSYHSLDTIRTAGLSNGYKYSITSFQTSPEATFVVVKNTGIAPIYYDAYPAINGVRATRSLLGLGPGEEETFTIPAVFRDPNLTIECDRLVPGQKIGFVIDY